MHYAYLYLIFVRISVANSKFVDQHTSSDEDFPSVDSLPPPVVKVQKQVTGAPPPLPIVGVPANVGGEQGASPSEPKGNYLSSMTVGGTMDSFLRMLICISSAPPFGYVLNTEFPCCT